MNKIMRTGDRVKVMPPRDQVGVDTIERFRGKVTVIKGVKDYRKGSSYYGRTYFLVGCKNDWGMDLEFCEEWLIPLGEGVEE